MRLARHNKGDKEGDAQEQSTPAHPLNPKNHKKTNQAENKIKLKIRLAPGSQTA